VAVAAVLVALAIVNMALVKTWTGEPDDGVLWRLQGTNVVAVQVARGYAGERAGILPGDVLLTVDDREARSPADVVAYLEAAHDGRQVRYVVERASAQVPLTLTLRVLPQVAHGLYYSIALVGILTIAVGASVRLRRPTDLATLHFLWSRSRSLACWPSRPAAATTDSTTSSTGPTSSRG
jgi:hypothetical protein